jgi:hypothetical protein
MSRLIARSRNAFGVASLLFTMKLVCLVCLTALFMAGQIARPSRVEMNLDGVPLQLYSTSNSAAGVIPNCPAGSSIRSCYQTALANYKNQGVTGVRVMFGFCNPWSMALTSCTPGAAVNATWATRVNDFLADVRASGIQSIALSPIFWGWNMPSTPQYTDYTAATNPCVNQAVRLYWEPTAPFGQRLVGYNPDGSPQYWPYPDWMNNGYNCSPRNPYFVGWQTMYNVVDRFLQLAANNALTVSELDIQQEVSLTGFTVYGRFITDVKHGDTGNPDLIDSLRYYMSLRGFDANRVTLSVMEGRTSTAGADCNSAYGDKARVMDVSEVYAAMGGALFGAPSGADLSNGLWCGGYFTGGEPSIPRVHAMPTVLDLHAYPCLGSVGATGACVASQSTATLQQEAKLTFNAVRGFIDSYAPGGWRYYEPNIYNSLFLLGETHSVKYATEAEANAAAGRGEKSCEGWPITAPWGTVRGYNDSTLKGRSLPDGSAGTVLRPWNDPKSACYKIPSLLGPYLPTP